MRKYETRRPSHHTGQNRQQQGFGEQLRSDASRSGSQRNANRDLAAAPGSPLTEQGGGIDANQTGEGPRRLPGAVGHVFADGAEESAFEMCRVPQIEVPAAHVAAAGLLLLRISLRQGV